MSEIALFCSTFALVFFLGLQSQVVRDGRYMVAFLNSFCIGAANLVLFKLAPNASPTEIMAYLIGGPFGIVSSMAFHKKVFKHGTLQSMPKDADQSS
jgi:hypothetical protein